MNARQYWTACRLHDWHYSYSDDPGAYREGQENQDRLVSLAHGKPELADIFKAWQGFHFDNGPRPTEPKLED